MKPELTEFIMHNEKFYKCLSKAKKKFISDLDHYNVDLPILPFYHNTPLDKNCEVDYLAQDHDSDQTILYFYIGGKDKCKVLYSVEYKKPYLYMSFGHIEVHDTKCLKDFSIESCVMQ